MVRFKIFALAAVVMLLVGFSAPKATAQISIGVNIGGGPPVCPYGYFDYAPYNCAPYGYYGPEWFTGGVFIGAGPWFHGPRGFHGHVNNHYDPRHGYRGALPARGGHPDHAHPVGHAQNFRGGNEQRDGHGHEVKSNNSHDNHDSHDNHGH